MTRFIDDNQKMNKLLLEDPLFGRLEFHKKFVNNSDFQGSQYLCRMPFTYAEVRRNGDVNVCCPNWSPVVVGNVLESSIADIWQGERAQAMRRSILDGSYRYCNWDTCSLIRNHRLDARTDHRSAELISAGHSITPSTVQFVVDDSCNLACPSCRTTWRRSLAPADLDQGYRVIRSVLDCMFAEPHAEHKTLSMDGSGEIFHSALYRHLFETHAVFDRADLWPNLRFRIVTNGTMMTEKIQQRHQQIMQRLEQLEVSVDAGNRDSYEQVRVGGHWDLLWQNLRHFHDHSMQSHTTWRWNMIIQKNNYQSLPELIDRAHSFERRPQIKIAQVLDWNSWSEQQYLEQAVHLPQHPEHEQYLEIVNSSAVQQYRRMWGI